MDQSNTGEQPLDDLIDLALPSRERERLVRVDALLRALAAHDREDPRKGLQPAALRRLDPGRVRGRATW